MQENKWARLLAYVTGLVNQKLLLQNEYLAAENRILRSRFPTRMRLADPERSTLAEIGKRLGRSALQQVACVANKRVNRLATIQEHIMILKAIKNGVAEDRIAKALNVDVASIRQKRDLLDGICKEAADILKTRRMSHQVFGVMKKMKPMRQIEVAELLVAASNFSVPYTKALLAATRPDMLVDPDKSKAVDGLSPDLAAKMQKEMEVLQRELKMIEASHGNEVLNLVLARGYLGKLFGNARIARYLGQHHGDIFRELQAILDGASLEP